MRRLRYPGKYPRKSVEKYKELSPENFPQDMARIALKGRTPLGQHKPILLAEILEVLQPGTGEIGADFTVGYGGHATEFLKRIGPGGRLYGFDQDPIELPKTASRLAMTIEPDAPTRVKNLPFVPIAGNFGDLQPLMISIQNSMTPVNGRAHRPAFNFTLADLGLSSMQIDQPDRGFTMREDVALDLRMNPLVGLTAAETFAKLDVSELARILGEYADEPMPFKMAESLKRLISDPKSLTTFRLRDAALKSARTIARYPEEPDKAVRRVFQALRIHVNDELGALSRLVRDLPQYLAPGARVAFLSFHSGEDRIVKKFFQQGLVHGLFRKVDGPMRASPEEIAINRRARSAKLRWGIVHEET